VLAAHISRAKNVVRNREERTGTMQEESGRNSGNGENQRWKEGMR